MFRITAVAVLAALGGPAAAQPARTLEPGARVRVQGVSASGALLPRIEGVVAELAGDTLTLRATDSTPMRRLTLGEDVRIQVYRGRQPTPARGAMLGGVVGLIAGGLVGVAAGKECVGDGFLCVSRRQVGVSRSLGFTAGGAALGLLLGTLVGHQRWEAPDAVVTAGLAVDGRRVAAVVSLSP